MYINHFDHHKQQVWANHIPYSEACSDAILFSINSLDAPAAYLLNGLSGLKKESNGIILNGCMC